MIACIRNWFKAKPHLSVFLGKDGWRVRMVAANGEIMLGSEAYASRANAVRAADNIGTAFGIAVKVEPLGPPILEG